MRSGGKVSDENVERPQMLLKYYRQQYLESRPAWILAALLPLQSEGTRKEFSIQKGIGNSYRCKREKGKEDKTKSTSELVERTTESVGN